MSENLPQNDEVPNSKSDIHNSQPRQSIRVRSNITTTTESNASADSGNNKPSNSSNDGVVTASADGSNSNNVEWYEMKKGSRPGDRYIRFTTRTLATTNGEEQVLITPWEEYGRRGNFGKVKSFLLGAPLATSRSIHERLGKLQALAVLSSDALSSVAYATEAALFVLVLAPASQHPEGFVMAISVVICLLIAVIAWSYRQTIFAYPNGGGSYIVAKDNLGYTPGLLAAGALMIDYVLTVAVSVAAGVQNLTSAIPSLQSYSSIIGIGLVFLLMLGNLRGIRESGAIFSLPTYFFIVSFLILIGVGLFQVITAPNFQPTPVSLNHADVIGVDGYGTQALSLFLILQAFASGCSAMTGVEAISNGVPAFKKPESKNAATTLVWMASLLIIFFLGISFLADRFQAHPIVNDNETIISQLSRVIFGANSVGYFLIQAATTLILILAANTSFADFPRLASLLSRDRFLPHIFTHRGDRLAFSTGILALGLLAVVLLLIFGVNTQALIPLYAVGVFLAFTLSQSGMVVHWQKEKRKAKSAGTVAKGASRSQLINGLGAFSTGVVLIIIAASKFLEGAWLVVLLIPILFAMFKAIRRHYTRVEKQLALAGASSSTSSGVTIGTADTMNLNNETSYQIIVPVSSINKLTISTLNFAQALGSRVTAIHVSDNPDRISTLKQKWEHSGMDTPLVILESPYRSVVRPLVAYLDTIHERQHNEVLIVMLPEFVARHWWEQILHNQTALRLKAALLYHPGIIVMSVPYQLT